MEEYQFHSLSKKEKIFYRKSNHLTFFSKNSIFHDINLGPQMSQVLKVQDFSFNLF